MAEKKRYAVVGTGGRSTMWIDAVTNTFKDHCELVGFSDTCMTRMKYHTNRLIERINHRSRSTPVGVGDKFVVYVPSSPRLEAPALEKPGDKADTAGAAAAARAEGDADADETPKDKDDEVKPASLQMTPDDAPDDGDKGAPAPPPLAP